MGVYNISLPSCALQMFAVFGHITIYLFVLFHLSVFGHITKCLSVHFHLSVFGHITLCLFLLLHLYVLGHIAIWSFVLFHLCVAHNSFHVLAGSNKDVRRHQQACRTLGVVSWAAHRILGCVV